MSQPQILTLQQPTLVDRYVPKPVQTALGFGLLAVGVYFGVSYLATEYKKKKASERSAGGPRNENGTFNAYWYAPQVKSAINPSGHWWVNDSVGDGTDLNYLMGIAPLIATDLRAVQEAYLELYQRDMLKDIEADLTPEQYRKFVQAIAT
jgi:hypothetical protein